MSRSLAVLTEAFLPQVEATLAACERAGYPMRPFFTVRNVFEQAKLWRQSRTTLQIETELARLRNNRAAFLAKVIESVGPQHGRHVTNAIPGLSWHQWGEAVDCYWLLNGEAEWSTSKKVGGMNGYQVYADIAQAHGLHPGGHWAHFKDWPHVQEREAGSPKAYYTLAQIDAEMRRRFDK